MVKQNEAYRLDQFDKEELKMMMEIFATTAKSHGLGVSTVQEAKRTAGWMIPYLYAYDYVTNKRWVYWAEILDKKSIVGHKPIPQIHFYGSPLVNECKFATEMLKKTTSHVESTPERFADFLLWGLGCTNDVPNVDHLSDDLFSHYYTNFDLFLVLDKPTDYLSWVLSEQLSGNVKIKTGYFPTPLHISTLMTDLVNGNEVDPTESVYEPCVGCGSLLLPQSNYRFRASGSDINPTAIKFCKVQMAWYAPWFYIPGENIQGLDD